ncbi:MAG: translation initiation factor IF-3 [bacterium]
MLFIAKPEEEVRVNEEIREDEVRVVRESGDQVGILPMDDALDKAEEEDVDLVEVAPKADPVVVKLMDYGKYKYEQQKARQRAKQNQNTMELKQLRLKPQIEQHDFNFKRDDAQRFLENNNKVRFQVFFTGRQRSKPEMGEDLLERMADELDEYGKIESEPEMQGHTMTMTMVPN